MKSVIDQRDAIAEKEGEAPLSEEVLPIWDNYNQDLRVFGLIDGSAVAPQMCDFYRKAIDLEETLAPDRKTGEGQKRMACSGVQVT